MDLVPTEGSKPVDFATGRLEVEVTRQHIQLPRLPKAFEGFGIAQLSDLHISPFMTAESLRRTSFTLGGLINRCYPLPCMSLKLSFEEANRAQIERTQKPASL